MKAPPPRIHLFAPSTAAHLKSHPPDSKTRPPRTSEGLRCPSKTADDPCRTAPTSQGGRTWRRGSVHWPPWAERRRLLLSLRAGSISISISRSSSSDPPPLGRLSSTADRFFISHCLTGSHLTFKFLSAAGFCPVLALTSGPEVRRLSRAFLWFGGRAAVSTQPGRAGAAWIGHREGLPFTHSHSSSAEDRLPQPREGNHHCGLTSQCFSKTFMDNKRIHFIHVWGQIRTYHSLNNKLYWMNGSVMFILSSRWQSNMYLRTIKNSNVSNYSSDLFNLLCVIVQLF